MNFRNLNILLSHAVLAGVAIYCLTQIWDEFFFPPHVAFGLIAINNIFAVFCWERSINQRIFETYIFTTYCQLLFTLPCITSTVWLQNGYSKESSWAWVVVPIFPLLCYLINLDLNMPIADLLILFNLVGLGTVSFIKENNYGIAATLAYAASHYLATSHLALNNYGLSLFSYFALEAIGFGDDNIFKLMK